MEYYFILKYIHIISAALLFGTGLGTAFFMLMTYLGKNIAAIKYTTRLVVLADWIFTTPAIIIQPVTGIWLMLILHYPFYTMWFFSIIALYILAGLCWIPVVFIQYRLRNMMERDADVTSLPPGFTRLMSWWVGLGIPAFLAILVIYWLMISKYGITTLLSEAKFY